MSFENFPRFGPVCTENLVRFDSMTESLNVGRDVTRAAKI
jgi:hypothetical protein